MKNGSIIDYLIATRGLNEKEAIDYFKHELCQIPRVVVENTKINYLSSYDLSIAEIVPVNWAVKRLIPQGLTILASLPKVGKSWMAIDIALSVANEKQFLGYETEKGGVLYLALEDSDGRIQKRQKRVLNGDTPPRNLNISTKVVPMNAGFLDSLEDYIKKNTETNLIIIDTLQKIRSGGNRNESAYASDYRELGLIKSFADKYKICIVVVHHLRKQKDNDIFNTISGTNGIMGVADTILIIQKDKRDSNDATLHITGRDVEFDELALTFDNKSCRWECIGNAEVQRHKQEVQEYNDSDLARALRKMSKLEHYGWVGTAQELLNYLNSKCGYMSDENPASFAKNLNKKTSLMREVDNITHIPPAPNGSGGFRKHTIKFGFVCMNHELRYMFDDDEEFDAIFGNTSDTPDTPDTIDTNNTTGTN